MTRVLFDHIARYYILWAFEMHHLESRPQRFLLYNFRILSHATIAWLLLMKLRPMKARSHPDLAVPTRCPQRTATAASWSFETQEVDEAPMLGQREQQAARRPPTCVHAATAENQQVLWQSQVHSLCLLKCFLCYPRSLLALRVPFSVAVSLQYTASVNHGIIFGRKSAFFYGIPQMWGVVKVEFMTRLESGREQTLCVVKQNTHFVMKW